MKPKKAWAVFIVILIIGIAAGIKEIKKRKEELSKLPPPRHYLLPVEAERVKTGTITAVYSYIGKVIPYSYATITTTVGGRIEKVFKREGDYFKKGETLIKIDDSQIKSEINSLKAQLKSLKAKITSVNYQKEAAQTLLKNALKELKRERYLYSKGAVPHVAVEKAENIYAETYAKLKSLTEQQKALKEEKNAIVNRIKALESKLTYTNIKAVKNGVVTKLLCYEGDTALPGKPLMKVFYPKDGLRVILNVPRTVAQKIKVKEEVKVSKEKGIVEKIYPAAEEKTGLDTVEIKTKGKTLKPFENAIVSIPTGRKEGIIVPTSSILHLKGGTFVVKVNNGTVKPVKVKILLEANGNAVVSGNLKEGDLVAVGRESKLLHILKFKKVTPEVKDEQNS